MNIIVKGGIVLKQMLTDAIGYYGSKDSAGNYPLVVVKPISFNLQKVTEEYCKNYYLANIKKFAIYCKKNSLFGNVYLEFFANTEDLILKA